MKIQVLSDEMASRIAAGEVVERPASVVKELMENSLDAGASEIFVWIEKAGTTLIRITDNGEGMAPEDLALAVERHATSKLKDDEDLFHIATLGFRGEALPSVGSVAKMEIVSRPAAAASGHRLRVDGGKKDEVHAAPAAGGTTIEIKDIFFNTPARKKFLKAPATELSHICDVVNRLALARHDVHFRLQHDGRTIADYVAVGDAKDRLQQVLGRDVAKSMTRFDGGQNELRVSGYLSSAPTSFPNARHVYTFVNRRYVRDKVITHAVMQGYDTLLMKGQYPAVLLFLEIPFAEVDVNVHPAKYEVRFRRQSDVHEAVSRVIRQALRVEAKEPSLHSYASTMPSFTGVRESALAYSLPPVSSYGSTHFREQPFFVPAQSQQLQMMPDQGFFSSLTVLGQILGCYLVCASSHGLALVDQHAAHERVGFEKLRAQLNSGEVARQHLLIPQSVALSAGEMMLVEEKLPLLEQIGFSLVPFGPDAYAITSVPALLPEGDFSQLMRQMVSELAEVDTSAKLRQHLEERLATMACHSVIRANRQLEIDEMRALLRELDQIPFATQCPHGRPVLLEFSRDELERMFKRVV
ncbi:MAG: DNA mismatch repair endonuclease MutL [Deltaproteobacteria bacterium]|nr:DNA mismatch repair endonuclease MutL [Deltaproteobacteria bacterium]